MKTMIHKSARLFVVSCLVAFSGVAACAALLGEVVSYEKSGNSLVVISKNGKQVITPYSNEIVKVAVAETPAEKPSKSVVMPSLSVKFDVVDTNGQLVVAMRNGNEVVVDKATSEVSFKRGKKTLLEESAGIEKRGKERVISFKSRDDEAFYGCGERGVGYDLKGDTMIMFNKQNYAYGKGDRTSQMNITVPFYISSLGYGVYFDDYTASKL